MTDFESLSPIVSQPPDYLQRTSWGGHIPFAKLLVDIVRPNALVELGTYYGVSYMAMCQAVKSLAIHCRCSAVDTWRGDDHIGAYSQTVLEVLRRAHDPAYGEFSTLLQMSFDEALTRFGDGSIDVLHIDGLHTYEAVRHDFESWRPKLSSRGVVILHDTTERDASQDFGVWQLWEEIAQQFPSFNFTHEHGLGVVAIGHDYPRTLDIFFKASASEASAIRARFCELAMPIKIRQLDHADAAADVTCQFRIAELERLHAGQEELIRLLRLQVASLEEFGAGTSDHVELLKARVAELERLRAGQEELIRLLRLQVASLEEFGAGTSTHVELLKARVAELEHEVEAAHHSAPGDNLLVGRLKAELEAVTARHTLERRVFEEHLLVLQRQRYTVPAPAEQPRGLLRRLRTRLTSKAF